MPYWVKNLKDYMLLILIACSFVLLGDEVRLNVRVYDDLGMPVSNALVTVSTQDKLIFGYGNRPEHFKKSAVRTDAAGMASVTFDCLTADFECCAESEGHYPFVDRRGRFAAKDNGLSGMIFESKETNVEIRLDRKLNPVPMWTYMNFEARKLPGGSGCWGFDLCKGDWVSPWGAGEVSDFKLEYHKQVTDSEYIATGRLVFDQPQCGFYLKPTRNSQQMKSDYIADTNACFQTVKEFSFRSDRGNDANPAWNKLLTEKEYLVMRTRVRLDENGNVISANYSKMYGPVVFKKRFGFGQITFNPNANDLNLESDPSKNLNVKARGCGLP